MIKRGKMLEPLEAKCLILPGIIVHLAIEFCHNTGI